MRLKESGNLFFINMTKKEKQIVPQIILNDLKYLSVRQLYISWFFNTGAEVANQLLDNIIKVYLQSTNHEDLIRKIRSWRGNETHNVVKMIDMLIAELSINFDLKNHKDVLENLYKLYQNRYLDSLRNTGECKTLLKDLNTIDYTYKYFRDRVKLSDKAKKETLINKLFLQNQDMKWGENKISLYNLFYEGNQHFKK
ncbi:hypothetical protein KKB10_04980 [Patescibacteria group bacterium]|nr:hypothetical protein [Patescibacteria group bacterium]MBU1952299.1 hypothetical protein [Patescibacteria group bacterium]